MPGERRSLLQASLRRRLLPSLAPTLSQTVASARNRTYIRGIIPSAKENPRMTRTAPGRTGFTLKALLLAASFAVAVFLPASAASALPLMVEDLGAPGSALNARAYDTARYMGAQYERRIVKAETWNGTFDWGAAANPYVDGAIANGLKPYLTITADWESFAGPGSRIPTPAQFHTECTEIANTFKGRVFDYAVWNEPNLVNVGNLDPAGYTWLYKECRSAIKAVEPAANIYFGELSTAASGWGGLNACQYFRQATPVNANVITEGVAIHPYQFNSPPSTKNTTECNGIGRLGDWQAEMTEAQSANGLKSAGGAAAPILVSEFGYCIDRPPLPPEDPKTPGAAQAACPQNSGGVANTLDEATHATRTKEAFEWVKLFAGVKVFDYHTVVQRPASDYLNNPGGYLWETGIVRAPSGEWTPTVAALRSAVAPANGKPNVGTTAASGVQATQATFNGTVDPNGLDTTYFFEYGPTTSYGSSTAQTGVGWKAGAVARSASVGNLKPGTTYHFRIVASNAMGTSYGGDGTFALAEPNLNGDNKADFIECINSQYTAAMSDGSQFGAPKAWSDWGCGPLARLGDFDGNGKSDLLVPAGGTSWAVNLSDGSKFNGSIWTTGVTNSPTWLGVGDFNGDGKDDMATCNNSEYKVHLANATGTGFVPGTTVWSTWGCGSLVRVGDFDGNGKDDIVAPAGGTSWAVNLSIGTGFVGNIWTTGVTNSPTWIETGDFN